MKIVGWTIPPTGTDNKTYDLNGEIKTLRYLNAA